MEPGGFSNVSREQYAVLFGATGDVIIRST